MKFKITFLCLMFSCIIGRAQDLTVETREFEGTINEVYFASPMSNAHVEIPWYFANSTSDEYKKKMAKTLTINEDGVETYYNFDTSFAAFLRSNIKWNWEKNNMLFENGSQFAFRFGNHLVAIASDNCYRNFDYYFNSSNENLIKVRPDVYLVDLTTGQELYDFGDMCVKGIMVDGTFSDFYGTQASNIKITFYYQEVGNYHTTHVNSFTFENPEEWTSSIKNVKSNSKVKIAKSSDTITFTSETPASVELYGINGQKEGAGKGRRVDIKTNAYGPHIYKIKSNDGSVSTGKIR